MLKIFTDYLVIVENGIYNIHAFVCLCVLWQRNRTASFVTEI